MLGIDVATGASRGASPRPAEDDVTIVEQALLLTFCALAPSFNSTRARSTTHRFLNEPLASHETTSFVPSALSAVSTGTGLAAFRHTRAVFVGFAYHGVT